MKQFADVEYLERAYHDAECIDGIWYYERPFGEMYRFNLQDRVKVLNEPQLRPRHTRKRTRPLMPLRSP